MKDHFNIRSMKVPRPKKGDRFGPLLTKGIIDFFKINKICSCCKGLGHIGKPSKNMIKHDMVTIKMTPELNKLAELDGVNLGERIRHIIDTQFGGKIPCSACHGTGFMVVKSQSPVAVPVKADRNEKKTILRKATLSGFISDWNNGDKYPTIQELAKKYKKSTEEVVARANRMIADGHKLKKRKK